MKLFATVAFVVAAATTASVSAQYDSDAIIPFAQEPEHIDADGDIHFVDQPGYSDANATRSLDFADLGEEPDTESAPATQVRSADSASRAAKDCRQVACWISSNSPSCSKLAAGKVQDELFRGRDGYKVESSDAKGMWVRYMRTQFSPPTRGSVADGQCPNGNKFVVTNCQAAGKVAC